MCIELCQTPMMHLETVICYLLQNFEAIKNAQKCRAHASSLPAAGGHLTGPIPEWLCACFPSLQEMDLSYNKLSGAQACHDCNSRIAPLVVYCRTNGCSLPPRCAIYVSSDDCFTRRTRLADWKTGQPDVDSSMSGAMQVPSRRTLPTLQSSRVSCETCMSSCLIVL